jgi:GNAT superfamily N-acetyltransferase
MYRPQKINEKWSTERYESPRTGKKIFARNQTTIDGHHVDVHFSGTGDKDFSVNYMVNGSYWRSPKMDKKTGQKIIGHVHRSIMSFARHMRPASLNFSSSKDRNIDLHAKLSARLARRHKGSVETRQVTDLTHHTVKFPMTESVKDVEDEIKAQHGVDLNIYHDSKNNDIHLAHISVPKGKRKQGIGSAAMKHLTAYADKHGHRIRLDLADRDYSFGTTSKNRLRRFYGRFGFVSNKGRNKDFTIRSSMYRKPSTMTESVSDYIPIHRGESVHNKAGGPMGGKFYSTDKEWARQFTQTGRLSEVKTRYIHKDHVLDKSNVYAGDDIEPHLHEAKNNGYAAVRFHEGNGEPHSIYVINHSKLRFTQR